MIEWLVEWTWAATQAQLAQSEKPISISGDRRRPSYWRFHRQYRAQKPPDIHHYRQGTANDRYAGWIAHGPCRAVHSNGMEV